MRVATPDEVIIKGIEGQRILIHGSLYGAEIAISLARSGKKVTLAEKTTPVIIGEDECFGNIMYMSRQRGHMLSQFLHTYGVELLFNATIKEIQGETITMKIGDKELTIRCDAVVFAEKRIPNIELETSLKEKGIPYIKVGDALSPRSLKDAIHEGAESVLRI